MDQNVLQKAQYWLSPVFDKETQAEVKHLIENDEKELIESFYKDLEFGTGGLRGIMGAGTNRMNKYTVGMAAQGLGNYVIKQFPNQSLSMAIAYDCRNNSSFFAETAAKILSGLGIKVYLFEDLRPTPELSFAIRTLNCQAGIVITASHNPKEYNGFKAYWNDGGQLIAPHDTNVIDEVNAVELESIDFDGNEDLIEYLDHRFDSKYLSEIKKLSLHPEIIKNQNQLKIVYTPIHGTGVELVPEILDVFGFRNVHVVEEQAIVDGDFPTVHSPNPEERSALAMAIEKAEKIDAELVLATDPDADRVGIAVRDLKGQFILLNGNQTGALLLNYLLSQWEAKGLLKGKEYIVKTIVTTELLVDMAKAYNVKYFDVLTGFKYIADVIKQCEGNLKFIGGGEESYGYLAGEFVRDKDAVMSCALIAEAAAFAKENGQTLYEQLLSIYKTYGLYYEDLVSVVKKGKEGSEAIKALMTDYRSNPPKQILGQTVTTIKDYQNSQVFNLQDGNKSIIDLPKSNVLQFFTDNGIKISVRPSGTEPKIKYYIGIKQAFDGDIEKAIKEAKLTIEQIKKEMDLN
ncbi:MAG: phospho-sugar mutase [Bacteroidales bacterium]|nr:phospho-sugar mutase [Bacteroidales bacterium]